MPFEVAAGALCAGGLSFPGRRHGDSARLSIGPFLVLPLALALILASGQAAPASPHFETIEGHRVLVVDGKPFLNLSAHLEESDRDEMENLPVETYLDRAKDLGLTAVQATITWDAWEDNQTSSTIRTNDLTREQLAAMADHARAIGVKLNLCWEGSNVSGRVNHAPASIYSPLTPNRDHAGTFHPEGDFPPPEGFDYVHDPAGYENYVLVTNEQGGIGADVPESRANFGVFCWNWPNTLAREKAALQDLGRWIAAVNAAGDVIVSLQVESEIREAVERGPVELTNPRCYCSLSQYLLDHPDVLPDGFDPDLPTLDEFRLARPDLAARVSAEEIFNQWSEQNYLRALVRGIREVLPELPLVINSFGDDDPATPETDNPGTPFHDVAGWLTTGVDIVGPDMYGFREEVFQPQFDVPGNVLWVPEIGVQYGPHFQIFGMFGSNVAGDRESPDSGPAFNGIGYSVYSLYGDLVSLFWGLLSDGITRGIVPAQPLDTWYAEAYGARYHAAFYTRNSFGALGAAMGPIARFAGTPRLVGFFDRVYMGTDADNFDGGKYPLFDTLVRVTDLGTPASPARGAVVMTDPWDFTLVGASYGAEIQAPPREMEDFRAERGRWDGDLWVKEGDVLPGTFVQDAVTGYPSVVLSADDTANTGTLEVDTGSARDLQYVVRIHSAPAGPAPTPTPAPTPGPGPSPSPTPNPPDNQSPQLGWGDGMIEPRGGGGCGSIGPRGQRGAGSFAGVAVCGLAAWLAALRWNRSRRARRKGRKEEKCSSALEESNGGSSPSAESSS